MISQEAIQRFENQETPFYHYDLGLLRKTLEAVRTASNKFGYEVHYALKANSDSKVLQLVSEHGLGADCVSGNEIKTALKHGFTSDHIAFAGVGKTDRDIEIGLDNEIFSFNVESVQELEVIGEIAAAKQKKARIALRVNPDVNANTHHYITTGLEENKFGINMWEMEGVLKIVDSNEFLDLIGLHFHIGSQIIDLSSYKNLCSRVNEFQLWFEDRGVQLSDINVGGGLGIDYFNPDRNAIVDFDSFFELFNDFLDLRPGQKLHFELGRSIVGSMGDLIARVLYIKEGAKINFAILDAGMTELIRPALYQSYHKVQNLTGDDNNGTDFYDIVGPICESSDCFGKRVKLPRTKRGDLIAIRCAGAYGEVMASDYNQRHRGEVVYSE